MLKIMLGRNTKKHENETNFAVSSHASRFVWLFWRLLAFIGAWIDGKRSWKQEKAPGWPLRVGVYVENYVGAKY